MESAFGVDHGDQISKKLSALPKAITPGKHAAKGVNITGSYGEVPMLGRGARGKAPSHRKPGEAVTKGLNPLKAFGGAKKTKQATQFGAAKPFKLGPPQDTPAQARAAKLGGMRAHESKVTGNKPLGFRNPNAAGNSIYRGPLNTGKPRR